MKIILELLLMLLLWTVSRGDVVQQLRDTRPECRKGARWIVNLHVKMLGESAV